MHWQRQERRKLISTIQLLIAQKTWFQEKLSEIRIKHKISNVNVDCKFIVISNLNIVPKETKREMRSLIDSDKNERLRYERMRINRMINQAIEGHLSVTLMQRKKSQV
jgi:hypothetical protein